MVIFYLQKPNLITKKLIKYINLKQTVFQFQSDSQLFPMFFILLTLQQCQQLLLTGQNNSSGSLELPHTPNLRPPKLGYSPDFPVKEEVFLTKKEARSKTSGLSLTPLNRGVVLGSLPCSSHNVVSRQVTQTLTLKIVSPHVFYVYSQFPQLGLRLSLKPAIFSSDSTCSGDTSQELKTNFSGILNSTAGLQRPLQCSI